MLIIFLIYNGADDRIQDLLHIIQTPYHYIKSSGLQYVNFKLKEHGKIMTNLKECSSRSIQAERYSCRAAT
jgi:hypothetical protein